MKRFCIFCGKPPVNKNNEHVIPQWLIQYTGELTRTVKINTDYSTGRTNKFSFNSYKFPACSICNDRFSDIENRVYGIMTGICDNSIIQSSDINLLLDWFDKVRIGIWLGNIYLNNEPLIQDPHFYINDRVALKDRCLIIQKLNEKDKGLTFIGTDTMLFITQPSVFGVIINDFFFISISSDYLLRYTLGLDYPKVLHYNTDQSIYQFSKGTGRIKLPLFKVAFSASHVILYQTKCGLDKLQNDCVLQQEASFIGNNFSIKEIAEDKTIHLNLQRNGVRILRQILKLQIQTRQSVPANIDLLSELQKKQFLQFNNASINFNKRLLENIKDKHEKTI